MSRRRRPTLPFMIRFCALALVAATLTGCSSLPGLAADRPAIPNPCRVMPTQLVEATLGGDVIAEYSDATEDVNEPDGKRRDMEEVYREGRTCRWFPKQRDNQGFLEIRLRQPPEFNPTLPNIRAGKRLETGRPGVPDDTWTVKDVPGLGANGFITTHRYFAQSRQTGAVTETVDVTIYATSAPYVLTAYGSDRSGAVLSDAALIATARAVVAELPRR